MYIATAKFNGDSYTAIGPNVRQATLAIRNKIDENARASKMDFHS
jgi:hypothetical protein